MIAARLAQAGRSVLVLERPATATSRTSARPRPPPPTSTCAAG
ncbi:MAG TPA: hypothetical protein VHM66_12100 [Solirubrobacterales bacterium]|nr:hypothetical protein [Solirubrobacterales bacterium]